MLKNKIRILQNTVSGALVLAPFMSCSPAGLIKKGMPNQGMGIHMSNPVLSIVNNAAISPPHLHHISPFGAQIRTICAHRINAEFFIGIYIM